MSHHLSSKQLSQRLLHVAAMCSAWSYALMNTLTMWCI
jgi:hypothetical protein